MNKFDWRKPNQHFVLFIAIIFFTGMLVGNLLPQRILFREKVILTNLPEVELPEGEAFAATVNIVAVNARGEGLVNRAGVEIHKGKGRILFNTNPFVEPDTQYSVEVAAREAQRFTGKSLERKDVIYSIQATDVKLVGGPSAGAALAVATVAAIENKNIKQNVALTGTIHSGGVIGKVSGVLEKAQAAAQSGIKLFLVPEGLSSITIYEQKTEEEKGPNFIFRRTYLVPKTVNLNDLMQEQFGMEVREVKNLAEAVQLMVEDF